MKTVALDAGVGLCIMHMRGTPETMQKDPVYEDLMGEVTLFLKAALERARAAGIGDDQIAVDPGIGFGKTTEHNLAILVNGENNRGAGVTDNLPCGLGTVGEPHSIDLEIDSTLGDEPVEIGYQVPDPSALAMDEAQPRTLTRAPLAGERRIRERVTVIPQRDGRLFINVRTSRSDDDGSASTMISIPIHVGNVDTSLQEHGRLETDAEGETTRVLTSN